MGYLRATLWYDIIHYHSFCSDGFVIYMERYYWISPFYDQSLFTIRAHPILRRFAELHGVELVITGSPDTAVEPYVQAIRDATEAGAAGLMVVGWPGEGVVEAINDAVEQGIPVITVDSDMARSKRLAHVGTDWYRMGSAMANKLATLVGDQGKVLMVGVFPLANMQAGFRGFQNEMAAHPDIIALDPLDSTDFDYAKAKTTLETYLDAHPDLIGIAAFDGNHGPHAARALTEMGLAGKVKVVCVDAEEPHVEQVKQGAIQAAFAQKREHFNYLAFQLVYAYNHGSVTTGYQPGILNITGNIDTGFVIVTPENAGEFETELDLEEAFAYHELAQRFTLISSMVENSAELALATDVDGHIIYANPATARLCGVAEDELGGLSYRTIFALTDEQERQIEQCIVERHNCNFETVAQRQEDERFPVQLSVSPMKTEGAMRGLVFIATDITAQKQAEVERERLQQEVIEAQQRMIQELSTPIIPILQGVIILPLVGSIDTSRARDITRALLAGISDYRAKVVILDVTGVPILDTGVANHMNKTIQAARLKGANTIITGISDSMAETIVDLGIDWSDIDTLRDLQSGLLVALKRLEITIKGM